MIVVVNLSDNSNEFNLDTKVQSMWISNRKDIKTMTNIKLEPLEAFIVEV